VFALSVHTCDWRPAIAKAYPLNWPAGWQRSSTRRRSQFRKSYDAAHRSLLYEIGKMGGTKIIVSTNLPLYRDGYPMTSAMEPNDPGVAVYFVLEGKPMAFACDRFQYVYENIEAIAKTIHALRGIQRWGASDMMERAFTGFKALTDGPSEDWRQVLGFDLFETVTRKMIESHYRELVKQHHPDMGGDREDFERVMRAREAAIDELIYTSEN
jgi:hypothetical protein